MTKRATRPGQDVNRLKTLLVVGAVAATLAGTRLLAVNDKVVGKAVSTPNPVTIIETAPTTALPMPPNVNNGNQAIVLDLAPVPQAVTPNIQPVRVRPVARTKTS